MDESRFEDLLESYALNALSTEERREFEDYLAAHPELQARVDEIVAITGLLALAPKEHEPPARLRESIVEQVRSEATPADGAGGVGRANAGGRRTFAGLRRLFTPGKLAAGVAAAVAVALLSWNVLLQSELQEQQSDLQSLRDDSSIEQAYALSGIGEGVVVRFQDREAVLMAEDLPPVPEDMAYQIWCITGEKTIPAGTFRPQDGPVAASIESPVADVDTVAVTIEPSGGSPEPTSDPFLVAEL